MRIVFIFILSFILSVETVFPQKVYTKDELDSIMNPRLLAGNKDLLRFDAVEINAGIMSEDDKPLSFSFKCRNVSDRQIVITKISTTCGCTEAKINNPVVKPGDDAEILLVFNPFGHPGKAFLRAFVYSDLSEKTPVAVLTVNGEVTPSVKLWKDYRVTMGELKLRSKTFNFGRVRNGSRRLEKIACANSGSKPLKVTAMKGFLPDFMSLRTEPQVLEPSEEGYLVIELTGNTPDKTIGNKTYKVLLDGLHARPSERMIDVKLEFVD